MKKKKKWKRKRKNENEKWKKKWKKKKLGLSFGVLDSAVGPSAIIISNKVPGLKIISVFLFWKLDNEKK